MSATKPETQTDLKRRLETIRQERTKLLTAIPIEIGKLREQLVQLENDHNKSLEPKLVELRRKEKDIEDKLLKFKKPRWPVDIPAEVLELCKRHWHGTTEFHSFRIHCWNDKAVWTSYPSGGYSDNGGWHPTPARFFMISRSKTESELGRLRGKELLELEGRVQQSRMQAELDKLAAK